MQKQLLQRCKRSLEETFLLLYMYLKNSCKKMESKLTCKIQGKVEDGWILQQHETQGLVG